MQKGRHYFQPYLGLSDFAATVRFTERDNLPQPQPIEQHLGQFPHFALYEPYDSQGANTIHAIITIDRDGRMVGDMMPYQDNQGKMVTPTMPNRGSQVIAIAGSDTVQYFNPDADFNVVFEFGNTYDRDYRITTAALLIWWR